jgi:hypothetical protein
VLVNERESKMQESSQSTASKGRKRQKTNANSSVNVSVDSAPSASTSSSSSSSVAVGRRSVKDIQNEAKAASTRSKYIGNYKRFHAWLLLHHPRLILEALPTEVTTDSVHWNWKGIDWVSVDWDVVITGYLEFATFNEAKGVFYLAGIHM